MPTGFPQEQDNMTHISSQNGNKQNAKSDYKCEGWLEKQKQERKHCAMMQSFLGHTKSSLLMSNELSAPIP